MNDTQNHTGYMLTKKAVAECYFEKGSQGVCLTPFDGITLPDLLSHTNNNQLQLWLLIEYANQLYTIKCF